MSSRGAECPRAPMMSLRGAQRRGNLIKLRDCHTLRARNDKVDTLPSVARNDNFFLNIKLLRLTRMTFYLVRLYQFPRIHNPLRVEHFDKR